MLKLSIVNGGANVKVVYGDLLGKCIFFNICRPTLLVHSQLFSFECIIACMRLFTVRTMDDESCHTI